MKTVGVFALVTLALPAFANAEDADSIVRRNELVFSTPFEQSAFSDFNKDKDFLKIFLANSPNGDNDYKYFQDKINSVVKEIEASGALKRRTDKRVKYIYEIVHAKFLSQYEAENRFYEIIQTGKYNCVTATALYALFFEKLGIPYHIKEEPTHVYVVAYPESDNIRIETTTPVFGFTTFNTEFKAKYVSTLRKQKIIGQEAASVEELFNKYFFGTDNITLTQLIGIHYLNDGLFKRDHLEVKGSYEAIMKGYWYYPSPRSDYLLMGMTADLLDKQDVDPLYKAALIGRLSRFSASGVTSEMVVGEFMRLTQTVLTKNNDKELYRKCYEQTLAQMNDEELAKEIAYHYNFESGRIYYNQGNFARAKPFFAKAMEAAPKNTETGGVFVSCLAQSFRNERRNHAILDSLEMYKAKLPMLTEYSNFNAMLALAYAGEFGDSYEKGDVTNGQKYQVLFEKMYETNDITLLSTDVVGSAYSAAAVYYFKKGQKTKAKQVIERGLEIVPENNQLRARKQMIN